LSEAYERDDECPFCFLKARLEREGVEYALGASMMEPDARLISNEKGYCRRHFKMALEAGAALPLGLVLETHLDEVLQKLETLCAAEPGKKGKNLFKKEKEQADSPEKLFQFLRETEEACAICDRMESAVEKFLDTFWLLYTREAEFKKRVLASKGFCLPHFRAVLETGRKKLSDSGFSAAFSELAALEVKELQRLREDARWFTKKFDYRYANEPWKNAKDAPKRVIEKLSQFV
jgi:hypothetical protein